MADGPPSARKKLSRLDLLILTIAASAITGLSLALAVQAYIETPNVANFWHFAEPASTKYGTKSEYLLGPTLIEILALGSLLCGFISGSYYAYIIKSNWTRRTYVCFIILFFLLLLGVVDDHRSKALHAARCLDPSMQGSGASRPVPAYPK